MAQIEGMSYERGGELLGTVEGSGQRPHRIFGHPDGVLRCSCPSWRFQKKPPEQRSCKHIRLFNEVAVRCVALSDDPRVEFAID